MIKYTSSNQLTLSGFSHPFDQELSPYNRWVKLDRIIPWDALKPKEATLQKAGLVLYFS